MIDDIFFIKAPYYLDSGTILDFIKKYPDTIVLGIATSNKSYQKLRRIGYNGSLLYNGRHLQFVGFRVSRSIYMIGSTLSTPGYEKALPKRLPRGQARNISTSFFGRKDTIISGKVTSTLPITSISDYFKYSVSSDNSPMVVMPSGLLKEKPYSYSSEQCIYPELTLASKSPPLIGYKVLTTPSTLPALTSFFPGASSTSSLAVIRCLARVKDMDINLGAAIGEGGQTLSLLLTSIRRLATSYSALAHGNLKTAVQALGLGTAELKALNKLKSSNRRPSLSSLWLELQYGWKPLLSDINDFVKFLEKAPRAGKLKIVGSAKDVVEKSSSYSFSSSPFTVPMAYNINQTVRSKCTIWAEIENPFLATASQLGLTNPAAVAWELTKFSFLVDWILPLGKLFDTLDAGLGWKFLSGTASTRVISNLEGRFQSTSTVECSSTSMLAFEKITKTRTVLASFPKPTSLRLKDPRSTIHYLNSLALLRQATKKGSS